MRDIPRTQLFLTTVASEWAAERACNGRHVRNWGLSLAQTPNFWNSLLQGRLKKGG